MEEEEGEAGSCDRNDGGEMDCRVCVAAGDWLVRGGGGGVGQIGGGFSHESEHDLALMVGDFLENGSVGAESWCSSDSDSALSDIAHLAEKIPVILSIEFCLRNHKSSPELSAAFPSVEIQLEFYRIP